MQFNVEIKWDGTHGFGDHFLRPPFVGHASFDAI